jgi:hypothetical protein
VYKHYKNGKYYRVIGVGKHSETLEDLVMYESLYDNETSKYWCRPLVMFTEEVEYEGNKTPRFIYIGDEIPA